MWRAGAQKRGCPTGALVRELWKHHQKDDAEENRNTGRKILLFLLPFSLPLTLLPEARGTGALGMRYTMITALNPAQSRGIKLEMHLGREG